MSAISQLVGSTGDGVVIWYIGSAHHDPSDLDNQKGSGQPHRRDSCSLERLRYGAARFVRLQPAGRSTEVRELSYLLDWLESTLRGSVAPHSSRGSWQSGPSGPRRLLPSVPLHRLTALHQQ